MTFQSKNPVARMFRWWIKRDLRKARLAAIRKRHGDFCEVLAGITVCDIETIDELLNRGCSKEDAPNFIVASSSVGLNPVALFELYESLRKNSSKYRPLPFDFDRLGEIGGKRG